MSAEQYKTLVRRLFGEAVNKGDLSVVDELIGPGYVNHNFPAPAPGTEGFKQVITMFRASFPDLYVTLHDVIVEGDKLSTRGSWRGTHQGEFMNIPATGKQVTVSYIDLWRMENGKLVENWVQMDILGLMQQLGVAPAP
ncbi:MAG: ester cyclase [Chloroflexota bacterium]